MPSPRDKWIQVQTANFDLFSDATEGKTKEIGLDLERLRAVLLHVRHSLTANSPVPTFLYVFKSRSAFEPFAPQFDGKPLPVDGYFQPSPDGNYICLTAAWNSDPRSLIYHEYLHYFLHANFRPQPLWFDEGTAEFYRSFHATDSEAQIGLPLEEHIALLRSSKMMPLEELFAVDQSSPEYNEQLRRGVFYAESWALMHYLLRGNPDRTPQLARFMVLMQQGTPRDEAFHQAFQMDYAGLLAELYGYVRQNRYVYARYAYADLAVPTQIKADPLPYADVLYRLGDLLAHQHGDRGREAEAFFRAALAADPALSGAQAGLGFLRLRAEHFDEAATFFKEATAAGRGDYRAYYYDGQLRIDGLAKAATWPLTPAQQAELGAARAALRRSVELNPNFPEARVALGRTYLWDESSGTDEGVAALEAATKMLPSRTDIATDLARLYDRRHEQAKADELLKATSGPEAKALQEERKTAGDRRETTDEINWLLAQGKEDEAVAALERLVASSKYEAREIYEDELRKLRAGVARNRAMREYNKALALYNKHDYAAALDAFEKIAAARADPDIARAAAEKAKQLRPLVKK